MSKRFYKHVGKTIDFKNTEIVLTELIGVGGNSVVYGCKYLNNDYVIKFFIGDRKKRYERYKSEIEKINSLNSKIEDFTPKVIESKLPKYKNFNYLNIATSPFYIMEKGQKYDFYNLSFEEKLDNVIEICTNLYKMHTLNIIHRDIKPENIVKYKGKLTFIDYGTAHIPGIETVDNKEPMGSKGTIAPEMINRIIGQEENENKCCDIYSLGKTMWIIFTNDRNAHKFTTYETTNINSKIKLETVNKGIVMAIEDIITNTTKENYNERIDLTKVIEMLILIRDGLLNNIENCNIMKFKCLLKETVNQNYDVILINTHVKIFRFIKELEEIGIILILRENGIDLCDFIKKKAFNIEYDSRGYYYFNLNEKIFLFKIATILIDKNSITIKTQKLDNIDDKNGEYLKNIDSFSKRSILSNSIDFPMKSIYVESDIVLSVVE